MTDPIKQLYNDLRSKGYSDSEDNLREALRDKKSASDYYRSNESNLGLDKDYFMSHVYEKSNIDIEISNKQIDIDNAKIEYKKIQDALYDNAKNNKQSPDELFQKVEELEGYISTENTNINSLKKQRSSTSKVYQNLLYPDSKLQSVIKKSGIDKQLQETDLSTQEYIRKKQEDLVQYLGEEDRNLYSVEYQINKELDNNAHIKSVIDNLSKKNKTSENDIQYLAANDALSKSDQILKDLYSFKERKEYEANIGIENAIQSEKKKRSEITESLLPSGYRDNDLVNKMINSDPKIKSDINSIDNNIRFLENKKAAILVDEKGIVSSYKPKIDAVDQLLPGISASPIVKLTAYAVAKQELLSEYKKRYDELSDSTVPDVRSSGQTENREQMDDLNAKINSITKELKELSPVVLLNRGKNASEVNKYSQSILKYYGNIAASGVYRLSQNILDTDLGYMDEKMRAEILVNSLDDAGVKGYMSEGARSDIYGDQDKISKLEAENSELIKSKVEKDTKDGRVEYWTDKTARDRYYNNLKDISNITGSLNKNEGVWIDLLGTTLRFGAETYISSLLMETGIGAMSSMAKLSKYSDRIKQAYDYLSKNKKTKAILDNISNPVKFEEAIKAGKVSRGDRYIAEATKDAINFEITGRLFSEKDISASEGFLGSIGSSAVEDITKYVGGGVTGLMNTKAKKLLGEFIKRTVGQIPAEFVEEEGEALSTTIKKAGQSDSIVSAVTDIIVNGLKGNDRWETIKEDFSRNMGYDAQKDILVATAYLSTIFGAAGTGLHARKIFFDNGGDAKMLEDMEFYLKNVKSVKYGGTTYQFTGEKWVTNKNEDVDNELASKLSKLSPDAKNGSSATIGSKTAIFANNRWETETGARLTGDDLDTIISAYKSKETAEFGFDKIDSISEGDNIVSGEGKSINGKAGDVIYADRGLTEFSTTAREGFVPVKLKYDERFIATSDGKYYRDQGSPISGSYEVKTGSEFALARAIKKATTRQGRSLRMISRLMPKMREIKKEVNGSMQRLRVILHDADSYLKQTNEASRGYYDPENHVVHINLSAATGVTSTHEVIHPYLNAMFDSDPELKTSFYNSVQDDYVALYGDVDEAIVEYATDRAIYSIVPKLDTDPTFFSKVLNTLQNYLGAKIHPDISLGSLISSISGISTEGKNPLMSMLSDVKKNAKKVDIGSFNTNTDRAVKLLGISTQDEDGMPFAKEDIDRRISESYSEMVASEDYFGDINESVYNNLAEINDERKKWIEFIDESDYPIEFKAAVLAEVLGYNYDNGYKKRGYGLVDSLNKDHVAKVFSSGSNEGILKQLHELRVKDKNKYQKIKQTESDKNLEDVNINTIENTGKLSTYRNDINLIEKLDNNQNESSLEKKLEYAKQVITGSRTIERLDQKEERGRIEGGQRNVEATIIAGTSQDASGRSESGYDERQRQENALAEYAKKEGIWVEDYETKYGEVIDVGGEARVYYDGNIVTKVNDISFHDTPIQFFDRITIHNILFPETPYKVVGFTHRNDTDSFSVIVQQPFVERQRKATKKEIAEEMSNRGYESIGGNGFKNENYIIEDLHSGNVWISPKGNLMFIDPIIHINTSDQGYGGTRIENDIIINKDIQQNNLTLENKLEYAKQGESIQRLSEEIERGRTESGTINAVATVITEAVHRDVKEKQGISNPNTYSKIKELEESSLKNYAEQNGLMDDLPKGEVISDGNESDIYHSEDDTKFIKVTTPNNYNSWLEMLDSIAIHNSENPNMKIKILGFTINKDGEFALKTEQNKNESNNQYQKIPTTTQRYYDAGELTKTDIDQFESSVKLMSADTAYETAISIVDTISKGKDALDILDSLIDFDKSEYNMHPIVVESNNKFLSTYVMLSAIAKAKELAEKIEDKYDKEFAKSVISSIQASLGDISRQAALTLAAFNSDIVPGEAFASALLPPNSDINKKDSRNSINENGIQSTDKEELQRVSTEIRDRLKKYIDDPNGSIDDIISKLLVKISSVENNNTNISAEKYARSIGSKKADKTIEKGRDLIASALTRLKNIGFAYDPKNELDALTDLFKGAIYIASGRISKAKDYFINAIENVLGKPVSYSENKWNDIINSEEGKGIIDTARKEWAIDKLKKLKDRHQKQSDTDLYDELFARIRAIKDKEVERVVKTIEETITNLSNDPELTQKQVDVLESAILQMENENSDTDSPAYKETQDKIEELRDMVEILSGKNVISKHSPEVKRRREIRKIINSGIEDRKTTIRRIINNYIEYGSLRYTLSDMLSMILPKSAADDLENSIFEELDNIINEKRKSLNKDEKNRLTKSIKDKSAEIEQLSSKINRLNYLNASLDILADRLSDASGNEAVNLQKQIESIKEEIKSISGQEAVTSRQDILETLKNRIEFLNNIDRTDAEELELAFNIDLMRSIEENKSLRDAHKDIDKIRSKLYSEYKKAYNKSEEKRKIISNLVSQIDSIKDGTYRKKSISEKEDTDSIKKLKEELRQLKGARGVMEGLTDRWTPSKLMKAIQQGATSLTDFYSLLESNTGISPKYRKAIAYVSSMVQNATIYENGNVINTRIAQKASAIIRNIKGQMQPSLMKKIFYSLVNEWAYNSMLSHPTTTINSILGSVTGWARVSAELVYRTLNSDDRKVTVSILKKMMHNGSLAMAIGQISGRSEYAVNDYEKQIMSIGVIDRIYNDTLSGIAKDKSSTKSKIAAKILVKAFVTPVKVAMNIFAATDVFSRNAFRTWNEQWDSYDKLKEVYTTGSHLGIIDAMHDELGYKEEIIQQANIEADRIFGSNSILNSVRKKEYISKRILELREYHIRDHVLVNHAEHTAKKMLLINNPETYIGSKAYNMLQHINRNEQEVSAMAIVGMFLKNMLIPFGRSLINFSHKHTVNAIIPVSYAMSKLGINLQYGSPQYDNYLSTVKAKKEYEALYEQYISADPKMKNELKKKLDEFIGGGVYMLDHKGKERREPYTKRDLRNDFIESMIGYALAGMIFYTYDDDENDYSDIVKAPSKIRVTGSGNGILFSEQKASNYTPYSIQIKKNGTWLTIAKWPYIAPHPIFFFMGTMTDNYYNRNSNYGSTSNPVYEAMYYLSTAPLAQSSQQGLQTIANIATGISTNDADSEKLENAFATALSNVSRQIIYPGAYGFATDLIRWASNKDIVRHENPYINKLIRLPYFEPFTDLVDYSPLGRTYKTKFPIEYLRGAFEDLTPKTDIEQIEQALSSTNANNVLKYYNVGKNISDDKDGSIIIKGFPIEISEEIRHSVAIEYGTRLVEDLRSRDITSQSKDYISIRKAIYNASEKIFDEVTKEIKHVYVSQYVRSIIEPYINEEISGNYTEEELYRMSRAYRYIKINDQSKSATKVLSELGMVIHDGRILFTRKMTDEEIDNAINSLSL